MSTAWDGRPRHIKRLAEALQKSRALRHLTSDVLRESTRMLPVALPDYVRFGPLNGLRLFHELTRFPSLDPLLHTPLPTLAVLGTRDPLLPPPDRIR